MSKRKTYRYFFLPPHPIDEIWKKSNLSLVPVRHLSAELIDFSADGCRLSADADIDPGELLFLDFLSPIDKSRCRFQCRVIWKSIHQTKPGYFHFGLTFFDQPKDQQHRLSMIYKLQTQKKRRGVNHEI